MLDSGAIYHTGRDKDYFPLVILDLCKIEAVRENQEFILEALLHFLVMVREKMLLPYYVERWSLLIDVNDVISFKHLQDFLNTIMGAIRRHFASSLHKLYLINLNLLQDKFSDEWNRKAERLFLTDSLQKVGKRKARALKKPIWRLTVSGFWS